jgi:hypothetical protein
VLKRSALPAASVKTNDEDDAARLLEPVVS